MNDNDNDNIGYEMIIYTYDEHGNIISIEYHL